jgi:hypothetical protein
MKLASKALRPHEDGLTRVLNDTMPGLVAGPSGDPIQATLTGVGTDDRILGADQHHRLLIRPDAFHVSVLFQPTLAFLECITEVLPFGVESARTASAVLDEFVLKIYLPQLEEKVSDLFHQAVTGMLSVICYEQCPYYLLFHARSRGFPIRSVIHSPFFGAPRKGDAFGPLYILCVQRVISVGKHTPHGIDKLIVCHATHKPFPPGKLLPADTWCHHSILPTM